MSRKAIPSWYFALVAVKKDNKYLLVQEQKGSQAWYLPAGRVEAGESFIDAAHRETLEEAGLVIEVNSANVDTVMKAYVDAAVPITENGANTCRFSSIQRGRIPKIVTSNKQATRGTCQPIA